mmetsp:Transcript_13911/g.30766  ORF Transcript_13911/g.30766 Transcript_13911/m.30766 type:complete len:216 (-) Transcript_13911:159-806(-)
MAAPASDESTTCSKGEDRSPFWRSTKKPGKTKAHVDASSIMNMLERDKDVLPIDLDSGETRLAWRDWMCEVIAGDSSKMLLSSFDVGPDKPDWAHKPPASAVGRTPSAGPGRPSTVRVSSFPSPWCGGCHTVQTTDSQPALPRAVERRAPAPCPEGGWRPAPISAHDNEEEIIRIRPSAKPVARVGGTQPPAAPWGPLQSCGGDTEDLEELDCIV